MTRPTPRIQHLAIEAIEETQTMLAAMDVPRSVAVPDAMRQRANELFAVLRRLLSRDPAARQFLPLPRRPTMPVDLFLKLVLAHRALADFVSRRTEP